MKMLAVKRYSEGYYGAKEFFNEYINIDNIAFIQAHIENHKRKGYDIHYVGGITFHILDRECEELMKLMKTNEGEDK